MLKNVSKTLLCAMGMLLFHVSIFAATVTIDTTSPRITTDGTEYGLVSNRNGNSGSITYTATLHDEPQPTMEYGIECEYEWKLNGYRVQKGLENFCTFAQADEDDWGQTFLITCDVTWYRVTRMNITQKLECATADARASLITPDIKIKMNGIKINNLSQDTIIGKKVLLSGEIMPTVLASSASKSWNIPGTRIKNFTADINKTTLTELEDADLSSTSIGYYWVDAADGRVVTFTATIGATIINTSTTFNVKKTTSTLTVTTGTIGVSDGALRYGTCTAGSTGIAFTSTLILPDVFNGNAEYWQQINSTLREKQKDDDSWIKMDAKSVIDTFFPYPGYPNTDDSPASSLPLSGFKKVTVADSFTMWLMFKPAGGDSIWVPLQSVNWSWSATATKDAAGSWQLDSSDKTNGSPIEPTAFPTWNGNITSYSFIAK